MHIHSNLEITMVQQQNYPIGFCLFPTVLPGPEAPLAAWPGGFWGSEKWFLGVLSCDFWCEIRLKIKTMISKIFKQMEKSSIDVRQI